MESDRRQVTLQNPFHDLWQDGSVKRAGGHRKLERRLEREPRHDGQKQLRRKTQEAWHIVFDAVRVHCVD